MSNDSNVTNYNDAPKSHTAPFAILSGALVLALCACGYLWVRANHLNDDIAQMREGTNVQFAKFDESSRAETQSLHQQLDALTAALATANTSTAAAVKRAQSEVKQANEKLNKRIDETHEQVAGELTQLKDSTEGKFGEFATDVNGVKTDVTGVKTEVSGVKEQVASAQTAIDQHAADLKRMTGDMGVMSGLIATNGKDLDTLRTLGERNYYEFKLNKGAKTAKVGDVILTLKKVDLKRNRYTVDVASDDRHIEKKDKTINEPVQIFVGGNRQPDEIVVNKVGKDEIVGYLAVPKVMVSRR